MKSTHQHTSRRSILARRLITAALACLATGGLATAQAILRVPADHATIQGAIDAAVDGDQVRVSPGTYVETINFSGKNIKVSGVGGAQATTIDANQAGTVVLFENGETADAILEDFTLTGGYGTFRPAGGIYCGQADPTIRRCVITGNHGSDQFDGAGGIQCGFASPTIRFCTLRRNIGSSSPFSTRGGPGAMHLKNSSPTVTGTLFEENRGADDNSGGAGALLINSQSNPVFVDCTFRAHQGGDANACQDAGEGVARISSSVPTFVRCDFEGNVAGSGGNGPGALYIGNSGTTIVRECSFVENVGSSCPPGGYQGGGGAGALRLRGSPRITACEFRANRGGYEEPGAISTDGNTGPQILDCTFVENVGGPGGGKGGAGALRFSGLVNMNPEVLRCVFEGNIGGSGRTEGGPGAIDSSCGGLIADALISGNVGGDATHGDGGPGAMLCRNQSTVCLDGSRVVGNAGGIGTHASNSGPNSARGGVGAIACTSGDPIFRNCVIAGNTGASSNTHSPGAGALEAGNGAPRFVSCTVVGNVAGSGPGTGRPSGMFVADGMAGDVVNSIFWNDPGADEFSAPTSVNHSLVRGGMAGVGNIDGDPLLVDLAAGDFHLRCASPCRDAGTALDPDLPEFDLDGGARVVGPAVDIGADEYDAAPAGSNYCVSTPNSTGMAALIDARGCNAISDGILPLRAGPMPNTFGSFFYGVNPVQVPFGNGMRCVGGAIFRLPFEAVAGGQLLDTLDYTNPPQPAGLITVGSTWYFQAYFRDPAAGAAQVDLSDGLQITFAP